MARLVTCNPSTREAGFLNNSQGYMEKHLVSKKANKHTRDGSEGGGLVSSRIWTMYESIMQPIVLYVK